MTREQLFGLRLQALRKARGWSLRRASQEAKVSHMRTGELEIGVSRSTSHSTRPSVELVKRLALAYEVPTDNLLELAGYAVERPDLARDEVLLVDYYRGLNEENRGMLIALAGCIKQRQDATQRRVSEPNASQ
jgi:transcriptional regulator with XRE-family HTH domain